MSTYTTPNFVIKVLLHDRKEPIDSHSFDTREGAEADLLKITDARTQNTEVGLPWLQLPGNKIEGAYIEDQSTSIGSA